MNAISLLKLALALLLAAQGAGVPDSLKTQAILVANEAITVAQSELAQSTTSGQKGLPTPILEGTGGIGAPVSQETCSSTPELVVTPPSSSNLVTKQYSSAPPWTHLVGYMLTVRVNDPCSKDWLIYYDIDTEGGGNGYTSPESFFVGSHIAGTHTVSISAHRKDYSKTIATTTVTWDSPGVVCDWPGTCI